MSVAKAQGKNCSQIFIPGMHAEAAARLDLKAELQEAIREEQFILHYQPIIDLASGAMTGVEALVRWQHPERGLVPPDRFIPFAEESGLILQIGRRVLDLACQEAGRLQALGRGTASLSMSVNLSGRQIASPSIVEDVRRALTASGIPPGTLILELTETVMMGETEVAVQRLRSLGVRLAVDDFGTGYSSLNYIRNFPLDILKVDRSFIRDISNGGEQSALAAAILDLAGIMNLPAVAEGIEEESQLDRLRELNCAMGQGYHFFRPMTADALEPIAMRQAIGETLGVPIA
jgi:EAL domain-containing protein (putative c-di-GMP-specific phosphodiesterase class I)